MGVSVGTAGFGVEVGWGVPVGTGVTVSVGNGVFVTVGIGVGVNVLVGVGVGVQSGVNVNVGTRVRVGGKALVGATDTNSTAPQAVPTTRTRTAIMNVMLRRLTVMISPHKRDLYNRPVGHSRRDGAIIPQGVVFVQFHPCRYGTTGPLP